MCFFMRLPGVAPEETEDRLRGINILLGPGDSRHGMRMSHGKGGRGSIGPEPLLWLLQERPGQAGCTV